MPADEGHPVTRRVRTDPSASRLAQALANPWRSSILRELTLRPMSVKQIVEKTGGPSSTISRHVAQLYEWGFIELVEMKSGGARHGGVERVYSAVVRSHLGAEAWAKLSQDERETRSDQAVASYVQRVLEAVEAKTFDADLTRHWSWDVVDLDEIAWSELTERLDEILAWVRVLASESRQRTGGSADELVHTTVGLGMFRSPPEDGSTDTDGGYPLPRPD